MATKTRAYRFSDAAVAQQQQLADALKTTRTDAINLAVHYLAERLGLGRRDAVAIVESIVREHGDDAPVTVRITNIARGEAELTIAQQPASNFKAFALAAHAGLEGEPIVSDATLYAREETTKTRFDFGATEPVNGASITIRAAELPDHLMVRDDSGKSPSQLRAEFKMNFELHRRLRAALGDHQ